MKNKFEIRGEVTAIFLKRRDGSYLETLIDTRDLQRAQDFPYTWTATESKITKSFYVIGYVITPEGKKTNIPLHRWILQPPKGHVIDHINHDTRDNRRCNLRVISQTGNQLNRRQSRNNSSGVVGVSWYRKYEKWHARVRYKSKGITLVFSMIYRMQNQL